MVRHSYDSPEGLANSQRARMTLRPGDIVWYPAISPSLVLIVSIEPRYCSYKALYPYSGEGSYIFHDDWELVGHSDALLAAEEEAR